MIAINHDSLVEGAIANFMSQTGLTTLVGTEITQTYLQLQAAAPTPSPRGVFVVVDAEGRVQYLSRQFIASEVTDVLDELLP